MTKVLRTAALTSALCLAQSAAVYPTLSVKEEQLESRQVVKAYDQGARKFFVEIKYYPDVVRYPVINGREVAYYQARVNLIEMRRGMPYVVVDEFPGEFTEDGEDVGELVGRLLKVETQY